MNTYDNRQNPHDEIDHIFKDLLPAHDMPERPAQIELSHLMLDAMLDGSIALCDAGTGIGKTYAYLVAGIAFLGFRATSGLEVHPIFISTSSIALQSAIYNDYLPLLSDVLQADGQIAQPIRAVIRKGKSHYVCDARLKKRLEQVNWQKKNARAAAALLSLRDHLDMDLAAHLSGHDQKCVCVPTHCDCKQTSCRYLCFMEACDSNYFHFQICNHNLLLADAIHRGTGRRPVLPDSCAVIIDEAHKLPETARQMFGVTLEAGDIRSLIRSLRNAKYFLAAEALSEITAPLLRKLSGPSHGETFSAYLPLLAATERTLSVIQKQLDGLLALPLRKSLEDVSAAVSLFSKGRPDMVFYTTEDGHGGTVLCATVSDLTAQLQTTLWNQSQPILLTSGTLAVGKNFRRFREETGLLTTSRVRESVSLSPFDYQKNCLLYLPQIPPQQRTEAYYDELTREIFHLLDAACGHALILFTSYATMSAVQERLAKEHMVWPLFTMGRNAVHTTEQFKSHPGSVLLATGAAWEGFDFPGDCVSLLVIPRLPFPCPDAMKEKEREQYDTLHAFIRAAVVPEMQIKLKQGFGRAIRTETDTCVVAILDERAALGRRYFKDVKAALPEMRITGSERVVEQFIRSVKPGDYFREGRL